ncbi:hypothetical protein [Nocardia abscessus]|uniref:hypothetical protein n=1 Tax=Nocardia abscessus TaxID=120957 RepID=UPI003CC80150
MPNVRPHATRTANTRRPHRPNPRFRAKRDRACAVRGQRRRRWKNNPRTNTEDVENGVRGVERREAFADQPGEHAFSLRALDDRRAVAQDLPGDVVTGEPEFGQHGGQGVIAVLGEEHLDALVHEQAEVLLLAGRDRDFVAQQRQLVEVCLGEVVAQPADRFVGVQIPELHRGVVHRRVAQHFTDGVVGALEREQRALARQIADEGAVGGGLLGAVGRGLAQRHQRGDARDLLGALPVGLHEVVDQLVHELRGDGGHQRALGEPVQDALLRLVHAEDLLQQCLDRFAVDHLAEPVVVIGGDVVVDGVGEHPDHVGDHGAAADQLDDGAHRLLGLLDLDDVPEDQRVGDGEHRFGVACDHLGETLTTHLGEQEFHLGVQ